MDSVHATLHNSGEGHVPRTVIGFNSLMNGKKIEQAVREILGLDGSRRLHRSHPDVLGVNLIGEIKSLERGGRLAFYPEQIKQYMRDAKKISDNERIVGAKRHIDLFCYVAIYDPHDIAAAERRVYEPPDAPVSDIYVLGKKALDKLLKGEARTSRWGLHQNAWLTHKTDVLRDLSQRFLCDAQSPMRVRELSEEERIELLRKVLEKHHRKAYIRVDEERLNELCTLHSEKKYNGASVRIHSSELVTEIGSYLTSAAPECAIAAH